MLELGFVFAVVRIAQHVAVVALAIHIYVLRNQVDVVYPDVHLEPGLTAPQEVRRLGQISHVVGRLEVPCVVKILGHNVRRCYNAESYS